MNINLKPSTRKEYEQTVMQMAEFATKSAKTAEEKAQIKMTMGDLLSEYKGDDRVISSSDLTSRLAEEKDEPCLDFPHPEMTKATDGVRPKQMIVVSGTTKQGKTMFTFDLVTRMKDVKPLLLFFEERPLDILKKKLRFNSAYKVPEFYTPELYTEEGIEWIKMRMLEGKYKWGCKVVVIDNLHYITQSEGAKVARYDKLLTSYTKELKDFATRWNMTIFLLVHMNKTPENRPPTVFDIADTAGIGQIADKVWFVQREADSTVTNWFSDRDRQTGFKGKIDFEFDRGTYHEGIMGLATEQINKNNEEVLTKKKAGF
jgi:replicative DNA helicase